MLLICISVLYTHIPEGCVKVFQINVVAGEVILRSSVLKIRVNLDKVTNIK